PPTIPMRGNYLIILFKEVPLASTIGVMGILTLAKNYGAQTWNYLEPLTIVALLFLLLSYPSALLVNWLEQKMNRHFTKNDQSIQEEKGAVYSWRKRLRSYTKLEKQKRQQSRSSLIVICINHSATSMYSKASTWIFIQGKKSPLSVRVARGKRRSSAC